VTGIELEGNRVVRVVTEKRTIENPRHVISSLPLRDTVRISDPAPSTEVAEAAQGLRYRDFLTVALVIDGEDLFPDNWIYIHEPSVEVGRIQNYRSWSPWMVPDDTKACVGLEYFCFEGDDLWTSSDDALIERAKNELEQLNLAKAEKVVRGYVVRVPKAYPMYDHDYGDRVATLRTWLDPLENFQQIGRNGLHRYNNSDHSSLTAIRTVDNIVNGTSHDIWAVNAESAYHEEDTPDEQPYKAAPETPVMQQEAAATDGDGATSSSPDLNETPASLANASPSKEN
jgi:protoporphyrinogen oxidase